MLETSPPEAVTTLVIRSTAVRDDALVGLSGQDEHDFVLPQSSTSSGLDGPLREGAEGNEGRPAVYGNGPNASTEVRHGSGPRDALPKHPACDVPARSWRWRRLPGWSRSLPAAPPPRPAVRPRRRGSPTSATATSGPCSPRGPTRCRSPRARREIPILPGNRAPGASLSLGKTSTGPQVWIVDTTGGSPQRLLNRASDPTWSPDGSSIAFVRRAKGNTDIWTADVDGSNVRGLTNSPAADLSPRGGRPRSRS